MTCDFSASCQMSRPAIRPLVFKDNFPKRIEAQTFALDVDVLLTRMKQWLIGTAITLEAFS